MELREKIAEQIHQEWMDWSKNVWDRLLTVSRAIDAGDINTAKFLIAELQSKWDVNWIPYEQLPEPVKDKDRIYADKIIELLSGEYL